MLDVSFLEVFKSYLYYCKLLLMLLMKHIYLD